MHFVMPGLAMNSHVGSVGSSAAAAGSACAANAASASPTSAPGAQPRSVLIEIPSLLLCPRPRSASAAATPLVAETLARVGLCRTPAARAGAGQDELV